MTRGGAEVLFVCVLLGLGARPMEAVETKMQQQEHYQNRPGAAVMGALQDETRRQVPRIWAAKAPGTSRRHHHHKLEGTQGKKAHQESMRKSDSRALGTRGTGRFG